MKKTVFSVIRGELKKFEAFSKLFPQKAAMQLGLMTDWEKQAWWHSLAIMDAEPFIVSDDLQKLARELLVGTTNALELDGDVSGSEDVITLDPKYNERISKALWTGKKFLKLPYPKVFFESMAFMSAKGEEPFGMGVLAFEEAGGIVLMPMTTKMKIKDTESVISKPTVYMFLDLENFTGPTVWPFRASWPDDMTEEEQNTYDVDLSVCYAVVSVLLVLNSPKVHVEAKLRAKTSEGNKKLKINEQYGYVTHVDVTAPVKEYLAMESKLLREIPDFEIPVRGHYKLRQTGVFWWNPYIRNKGAAPSPRDHYELH